MDGARDGIWWFEVSEGGWATCHPLCWWVGSLGGPPAFKA